MNARITPTVGRKVWFYEYASQAEPIDATIIKVWGTGPEAAVNLDVTDPHTGAHTFRNSVQVGDENTHWPHYRWMPYQQGQARAQAPLVDPVGPLGAATGHGIPTP